MRIISQNGITDIPYDLYGVRQLKSDLSKIIAFTNGDDFLIMAEYSTETKAQKAMEMLRTAYTGRFVTNANVPDDFNEQIRELMKGGFGTVIVKDTNDSRVEFNNLNGYFQFPQDEDVEV